MSVPVEQLEIAIPQGYGLFIKTIFQASSSTEPLELQFGGQIEYLAVSLSPHLPVVSPCLISGHPWGAGRFPIFYMEIKPVCRDQAAWRPL